jgi:hypothetical protein
VGLCVRWWYCCIQCLLGLQVALVALQWPYTRFYFCMLTAALLLMADRIWCRQSAAAVQCGAVQCMQVSMLCAMPRMQKHCNCLSNADGVCSANGVCCRTAQLSMPWHQHAAGLLCQQQCWVSCQLCYVMYMSPATCYTNSVFGTEC